MCLSGLLDVSAPCTRNAHGGLKQASDPLGLEVQMLVSHHVGAKNGTQVLCKSNKSS